MKAGFKQVVGACLVLLAGFGLGRWASPRDSPEPAASPVDGKVMPVPGVGFPMAGAAELPARREFRPLEERDRDVFAARVREFHAAKEDAARLAVLDEIEASCYGDEVLTLTRAILAAPADEIGSGLRSRAIRMLAGNSSAEILPVLALAREEPGDALRIQAVMAALRVEGAELEDFIAAAFEDRAAGVRFAGLDVVDHQKVEVRERLFARAMLSPRADVALAGLGELETDATAASIPLIVKGLSAPSDEVRAETRITLEFILDEVFQTEEQASEWWHRNRLRFDRELNRLD